ncbi:MAG: hypothetical protein K8L97_29820 [Anaerolineae bacterium]|nr:hypothetical protein [Anaerolineae bacterium]
MFPEDRVLVGVINRKRDLDYALTEHWYRIPQWRMPRGVNAEYVAFFLSRAFKLRNGGVHYYATCRGLELAYRRDLMPKESEHPRANEVYYKIQLSDLVEKSPPVLNTTGRSIGFVYTTWDRFVHARTIADLYSREDYFVDRIYHALRNKGVFVDRTWSVEYKNEPAQLRILCENGTLTASTERAQNHFFLDDNQEEDVILNSILAEIARQGGTVMLHLPFDSD